MSGGTNSDHQDSEPHEFRLQKFLATAGVAARRACEEYIRQGRVQIDNHVVKNPATRVDPERQEVRLDGEIVKLRPRNYFLLNKPGGVVCTNRDPSGRTRAIDLVPQDQGRLFTVGRLDENSLGLLLITNDGDLANRLAHPRFQVPRIYRAHVAGVPNRPTLEKLQQGLWFSDGRFRIRKARKLRTKGNSSILELTLTEGQNREIRRLLARMGHKVMRLERIAFGPLKLGRLAPGRWRTLGRREISELRSYVAARKPRRPTQRPKMNRPRSASSG